MIRIRTILVVLALLAGVANWCAAQSTDVDYERQLMQDIAQIDAAIRAHERSIARLQSDKDANQKDMRTAEREAKKQKAEFDVASNMVEAVEKPLKDAKEKLDQSDKNLKDVTKRVKDEMDDLPESVAARKAFEQASETRAAARTYALAPLTKSAEYNAAVEAEKAADANLLKLKYAKEPQQSAIAKAAETLLEKQRALAAMEQETLKRDEAYQQAETGVTKTNAELSAVRSTYAEKLKNHPERLAAADSLDTAKAKHGRLQASFADATKRQAKSREIAGRAQNAVDRLLERNNAIKQQINNKENEIRNLMEQREEKRRFLDRMR